MTMTNRRTLATLLAFAVMLTLVSFVRPMQARADHCEPTEPAVRVLQPGYEEPGAESDNPLCYVLLNYVYPRVCDDPTTLLQTCINSIDPDPQEPIVVFPYNPNPGRMYCSYVNFIRATLGQSGTCTY